MAKNKQKKFSWRAFISLYIVLSFIVMIVTGIVLYIAPPGRIAHWVELTILGLTKEQWQALHTIFTFLFIIAGAFHIYFNWKPFKIYLRTRMQQKVKIRKELIWSAVLSFMIFGLVLADVPPFSTIIDLGEEFSDSWSDEESEPPVPHAEKMTLQEFAEVTQISLPEIISNLENNGIIPVDNTSIIGDLAEQFNLSPKQIYEKIAGNVPIKSATKLVQGSGYGRKTIAEICEILQIPIDVARENLAKKNIEAELSAKIKNIASDYDVLPIELVEIMKGE